jgi:hypothetical protein
MSKIEAFWQDATADDVARVMAGETVEARFRNSKKREWENGNLRGWSQVEQDKRFWDQRAYQWLKCQVYREPSWYTERPDPGPGFRLLEKFPDEPKLATDEAWRGKSWRRVLRDDGKQEPSGWYRRRIEPVEAGLGHHVLRVGDSAKLPNGQTITITAKGFEVTQ